MISASGKITDHLVRIEILIKSGEREVINIQESTQMLGARLLMKGLGYKIKDGDFSIVKTEGRSA